MRALQWDLLSSQRMTGWWKRRVRESSATVRRVSARLDQPAALERLLQPLPEREELRARLAAPLFVRAWDAVELQDHWVSSDGREITCYTLSGLTLKQAAAVRVRWDAKRSPAALSEEALADVIAAQIGAPVTIVG